MNRQAKVIVLAAGKGKRLRESEDDRQPKVMKKAAGKPLLEYVLSALSFVRPGDIIVVVGYGKEQVQAYLRDGYPVAVQQQQLGTANAVEAARGRLSDFRGDVLVCAGDMPLVRRETYRALLEKHAAERNACTLLTATAKNPAGYGRIVRAEGGAFSAIVEEADCSEEQRKIREINASIYVFNAVKLFEALGRVSSNNKQAEYYLTDVPAILKERGEPIGLHRLDDDRQLIGVNTIEQLKEVEGLILKQGI